MAHSDVIACPRDNKDDQVQKVTGASDRLRQRLTLPTLFDEPTFQPLTPPTNPSPPSRPSWDWNGGYILYPFFQEYVVGSQVGLGVMLVFLMGLAAGLAYVTLTVLGRNPGDAGTFIPVYFMWIFIICLVAFGFEIVGSHAEYTASLKQWRKLKQTYEANLADYSEQLRQFHIDEAIRREAIDLEHRRWEKARRLAEASLYYCLRHDIVFLHPNPPGLRVDLANGVAPENSTQLLREAARLTS